MGLDTTHNCWSGAYSAFHRWRNKISEVAGYGPIDDYQGFGGKKPWPQGDPLITLLDHSDCDGEIAHEQCGLIADRLESLYPALKIAGEGGGHIGQFLEKTQRFVAGLRAAHQAKENVGFH